MGMARSQLALPVVVYCCEVQYGALFVLDSIMVTDVASDVVGSKVGLCSISAGPFSEYKTFFTSNSSPVSYAWKMIEFISKLH